MKPQDFDLIRKILRDRSGLVLGDEKAYLLESRLVPVARKFGMKDIDEVLQKVRTSAPEDLIVDIVEAMTTNESFFFRDVKPFDLFKDNVLEHLIASRAGKKSFRIWCAAASSGQEPYSLAILLKEAAAKLNGWRTEIVGTDISNEILGRAKQGRYSQFEVQRGLAIQMLVKYFTKDGEHWQIKQEVRDMVSYREFNLLDDFAPLGKFDVVFCRNVLIYFDQETKKKVLERIAMLLPEDGVIFLGGAETVLGITDKFEPVAGQRGIYKLTGK